MAIISQNLVNRKTPTQAPLLIVEQKGTAKPTLDWVNTNRLKIDHSYQRITLSESNIKKILKKFNWSSFGALMVMDRDGVLYVVDGQHRLNVALRLKIGTVPCFITKSLGVAYEAEAFDEANCNTTAVNSFNKWSSRLTQGNEVYVQCEAMLDLLGVRVKQGMTTKDIAFPAGLVKTFAIDPKACEYSLLFQRAMIGAKEQLHEGIHKGLFYLLREIQKETGSMRPLDDAYRVFAKGGKPFILNAIKSIQFRNGFKDASILVCSMGVCDAINSGIKRNKIIFRGLDAA